MGWGNGIPRLHFGWLAVILIAMASASGCATLNTSATPAPTATAEPPLDAEAVLRRAAKRMLGLRSATFVLDHRKGSTSLFPGVELTKASGVVDIPDKYRVVVEAQSTTPKAFIEVTVVSVDGEVRMTDFFTGRGRVVPQSVWPVDFSQLGVTVAEIIRAVTLPELLGTETVGGLETWHIRGAIKAQELAGLVPGAGEGSDVGVDLWVEMPGGLLVQVLISGPILSNDIPDVERLLTLGDFDLPVVIDLPE